MREHGRRVHDHTKRNFQLLIASMHTRTNPTFMDHLCPLFVFDVESIGLHGEGYAVGYVVMVDDMEVEFGMFACPTETARGFDSGRKWVRENIPRLESNSPSPLSVREKFWARWMVWKQKGALMAVDCGWPVEARFLAACVDDVPNDRMLGGPYPMVEISSVMMAAGLNPMLDYERLSIELPKHNPLADAKQSARLLVRSLSLIEER